uniref:Uncharacterized protein n=1 Tax=Arundo donax TaxID=35708 RepID=A0A0A8Z089_ARUDO
MWNNSGKTYRNNVQNILWGEQDITS